jgi:hypothetical protein
MNFLSRDKNLPPDLSLLSGDCIQINTNGLPQTPRWLPVSTNFQRPNIGQKIRNTPKEKECFMEKLLPENIVGQIRDVFQQLKQPVQILFFGSQDSCEYCTETRQLLEEVSALSDLISLSVHDLAADIDLAKLYKVEGKAPAIVIAAREGDQITDYGIRYLGIPSGHEFTTLIQSLLLVSGRDSGLSPQMRNYVQALTKPLHLQVFVTPT